MTTDPWDGCDYRPNPDCRLCKGAGFVHPLDSYGHPVYSKLIPCPEPDCMRDNRNLYRQSGPYLRSQGITRPEQTFANFLHIAGTETALKYAQEFASGKANWIWLLIYGGVGNGKTHLCNAVAKKIIERGFNVKFTTAMNLISELKLGMKSDDTEHILNQYKHAEYLVIDDYGVEYSTDWERATFEHLLTERFAIAGPTMVTTNLDITQLSSRQKSRFDDRHYSRIVHNSAGDYRKSRR